MSKCVLCCVSVCLLLGLSRGTVWADPPAENPLPPPRPVIVEELPPAEFHPAPVFLRANRYDVWQYYGVDRQGRFRPRVVYAPHGPYYLHNGAPYPYAATRSLEFMPYVVD